MNFLHANVPLVSYTLGDDLSGSLQGAGGIGGLLARTHDGEEVPGSTLTNAFYHADGNGNVTCMIFQSQQIAAKYLYDPYGNMLAMCGPLAGANRCRFSSKEWINNADLYYYGYRFYDPDLQRWLSRDPLTEVGFEVLRHPETRATERWDRNLNLYGFAADDPENEMDAFGLSFWDWLFGPKKMKDEDFGPILEATDAFAGGVGDLDGILRLLGDACFNINAFASYVDVTGRIVVVFFAEMLS